MKVSSLSLRDLEYLVAVADHQHFGKAAEACHVSQPALSSQVAKLENLLGVKLFERSNRRVAITSDGQRVTKQARVVLEEAAKIPLLAAPVAEPLQWLTPARSDRHSWTLPDATSHPKASQALSEDSIAPA